MMVVVDVGGGVGLVKQSRWGVLGQERIICTQHTGTGFNVSITRHKHCASVLMGTSSRPYTHTRKDGEKLDPFEDDDGSLYSTPRTMG